MKYGVESVECQLKSLTLQQFNSIIRRKNETDIIGLQYTK